jgi:hypothetical protein
MYKHKKEKKSEEKKRKEKNRNEKKRKDRTRLVFFTLRKKIQRIKTP